MYKRILEEIINIPSLTGKEDEITTFIQKSYLKKAKRFNNNLVYIEEGTGPIVLLVGHSDTVPVDKNQIVSNDETAIYGRGSVDMKSGLAYLLYEMQIKRNYRRAAIVYEREEGPLPNGVTDLIENNLIPQDSSMAILFEPTYSRLEFGCRGSLHFDAVIKGVAVHSARPHLGINALYETTGLIKFLEHLKLPDRDVEGVKYKEHLTPTVVQSVGPRNSLPQEIRINLNFRFSPDRTLDEAFSFCLSLLAPYVSHVDWKDGACGAKPLAKNHYLRKYAETNNIASFKEAWTDVAQLSGIGINSFNFGPGDPLLCHQANEHLFWKDFDLFHERYQEISRCIEQCL